MGNAIYPHRGKVISEIILKFWHRAEFWTCFHSFPTEGKICFCINNFRIKTLEMNSYGICQCCLRQFSSKLRKDLRELGLASFLSLTAVVFLSTGPCLLPITMKKASVVVKKRGGRGHHKRGGYPWLNHRHRAASWASSLHKPHASPPDEDSQGQKISWAEGVASSGPQTILRGSLQATPWVVEPQSSCGKSKTRQ